MMIVVFPSTNNRVGSGLCFIERATIQREKKKKARKIAKTKEKHQKIPIRSHNPQLSGQSHPYTKSSLSLFVPPPQSPLRLFLSANLLLRFSCCRILNADPYFSLPSSDALANSVDGAPPPEKPRRGSPAVVLRDFSRVFQIAWFGTVVLPILLVF